MMIIPAVDVLDHEVVQLAGGRADDKKLTLPDPFDAAMSWVYRGAPYLHLVDLDGAFGKGDNKDIFKRITKECGVPVQIGGGIRSKDTVDDLISSGADRIILGTRAVKDPDWLISVADDHPGKIILGMDTRDGQLAVNGWQTSSEISVENMFDIIKDVPLAAVLNTNIGVEGQMKGIDRAQASDFIKRCPHGVIASGGITSKEDCRVLSELGAMGAVVGLAIYTDAIRPWEWRKPWIIE